MELKEKVIEEIKKIYDPEIPVNIYEPVSYTHLTLPTNREV